GHPVVFAGAGEALDGLAEVAAVQLGAALAGRADQYDREPLVVRHRDQGGLVRLEVVQPAGRAPRPGPQGAPVVRLARLALVAQADDALGQAGAVVGLDGVRDDGGVAPAVLDQLLRRRRSAAARTSG